MSLLSHGPPPPWPEQRLPKWRPLASLLLAAVVRSCQIDQLLLAEPVAITKRKVKLLGLTWAPRTMGSTQEMRVALEDENLAEQLRERT